MKKTILLLFLPLLFFSQRKETIKLKFPLKDYTGTTKSLEVIDHRKNKKIQNIVFRGNYYTFSFPTDDLEADLENWFLENNKKRNKATNDIVLLIEDLEISNEVRNKEIFCVLDMKFSTFLKEDDHYYFLKKFSSVLSLNSREVGGIPNLFVENTQKVLQKLMFDTYRAVPSETAIPTAELFNYNEILKEKYAAFSAQKLKDGIYLDYASFFNQTPVENYELVRNEGEVVKAMKGDDDKIPTRKIFIYVENGKAFKNSALGFLELKKDAKGFFVEANEGILFPEEIKISLFYYIVGGLPGIVVGGIVEGIRADAKQKKAMKSAKFPIYIDFLNGEYEFVK